MNFRFFSMIALSSVSIVVAAGDYFPIAQGNTWLFSSAKSSGGWGMVTTDSGTVQWQMQKVTNDTAAAIVTTTIAVRRTYNLRRRIFNPGGHLPEDSASAYDSVFIPPRTSGDTVYIKSSNKETGVLFQGDACWSFVHDPKATLPAGRLSVRDTTVSCLGKLTSASIIDPSPCRSRYTDLSSYITVKEIGPVEYHKQSSPYIMDAYWSEDWKLLSTNVTTAIKIHKQPVVYANPLHRVTSVKHMIFEGIVSRAGKLIVTFYNANGAILGKYETEISSPGFHRIEIPGSCFVRTASACVPRIIKLLTPDGMELIGKAINF
jgi:hypothetical protein